MKAIITMMAALLFLCQQAIPNPSPADTIPLKAKPIVTTLVASAHPALTPSSITLRILNDSGLRDYANIVLDWELWANGALRQKGSLSNLLIAPKHPSTIRLPARAPQVPGEELLLNLKYHYRKKPAPPGQPPVLPPTLAEESLLLQPWTNQQLLVHTTGELSYTDENGLFTVQSPIALIRWDKQTGWLQTYDLKNEHFLADTPGLRSRFSPEPGDVGYAAATAGAPPSTSVSPPATAGTSPSWAAASQAPHLQLFSTSTGSQLVIVRAEYTLPETSCLLHLSYTINAAGEMEVEQSMEADSTKQGEPLPCFGMYWRLPPGFDTVTVYEGSSPLSVIPSRETGQLNNVRWLTITRSDKKGLRFTADSSLLNIQPRPSDGDRLTAALSLAINHPAPSYPLPYGNYRYAFKVTPVLPAEITKPVK